MVDGQVVSADSIQNKAMYWMLALYALAGAVLFAYLGREDVVLVWLALLLLALMALRLRWRIERSPCMQAKWQMYSEHLKVHMLQRGLVVAVLFSSAAGLQVWMVGFDPSDLADWYDDLSLHQVWKLMVSPFIHSSVRHWLANFLMAMVVAMCLMRESFARLFLTWLGSSLLVVCFSVAWQASQLGPRVVVGASAGLSGLLGAAWSWSLWGRDRYPRYFARFVAIQFVAGFVLLASIQSLGSVLVHLLGFVLGVGLAHDRKPGVPNYQTR